MTVDEPPVEDPDSGPVPAARVVDGVEERLDAVVSARATASSRSTSSARRIAGATSSR
ncbi:hypothetical protein ACPPVS_18750 [Cellulomonas sp. McL0617]|uniref:hypothetical protein n=1 Tax=Cellulomonas sp. McL0617 TaxID=3415675 RepID=UPI003CF4F657